MPGIFYLRTTELTAPAGAPVQFGVEFLPGMAGESGAELQIRKGTVVLAEVRLSARVTDANTLAVSPALAHFTPGSAATFQIIHGWPDPLAVIPEGSTTMDQAPPFVQTDFTCADPAPSCVPCSIIYRFNGDATATERVTISAVDSDGRGPPSQSIQLVSP